MKVLVVGGAGYVGGVVTDLFIKQKHKVLVYDNLTYEESFRKNCDFIYGDVRNKTLLKKFLKWADLVVWMAALVGDGACSINPKITFDINSESVKFLAKNFKKKIIFFSTCSVYGEQDGLIDESAMLNPLSIYAKSKIKSEKYLQNSKAFIFRLGTLFGVGDDSSRIRMDLAVNTLTAKAFYEKKLTIFGGEQYRPLLHVKDAARAIVHVSKTNKFGVYDLGYKNYKILDLGREIRKIFNNKVSIKKISMKFQDTRNYRVKCEKMRKVLNFKPIYTVKDGVNEIHHLLKSKRIKDINDPRYTNQKFLQIFKEKLKYEN